MARLPPSRHSLHRGLRIPDLRAGGDSPRNRSCRQAVPATCPMRRVPAQRIHRCGLNATSQTPFQRCDADWWLPLPQRYRAAHAAPLQPQLGTDIEICDTVRLVSYGAAVVAWLRPTDQHALFVVHGDDLRAAEAAMALSSDDLV